MKKDFIDKTFDGCVSALELVSKLTHLSYRKINVLLFCVTAPAIGIWLGYKAFKNKD